jgi:site-specific DNA-methyltransferase (adenine-specific)
VVIGLHAELDTGIAMNLMLGDCLERMKEIPDGSVDMILADPPYGTTACKWDSVIDLPLMWEQLKRIIKPSGAVVLFAAQPFTSKLIASNYDMFAYCWYWLKSKPTGFPNANVRPMFNIEDITVFSKGKANPRAIDRIPYNPQGVVECTRHKTRKTKEGTVNNGEKDGSLSGNYTSTLTNYPRQLLEFASESKTQHPTQKPVDLMEYLIKTYTNEGETVLDFCIGSGTTGVACMNTNRKFIGIEKDAGYFEIAKQRLCV